MILNAMFTYSSCNNSTSLANMQNQCESLLELTYKEKVLISFGYNQIVYLLS